MEKGDKCHFITFEKNHFEVQVCILQYYIGEQNYYLYIILKIIFIWLSDMVQTVRGLLTDEHMHA